MIQPREIKRLKGKTKINLVFSKVKVIKSGDLNLYYVNKDDGFQNIEVGVGVSKKFVLLATRRNRIKRQINGVIQKQNFQVIPVLSEGLYMIVYKGGLTVKSESIWKDLKGLLSHFDS